LREDAVRSVYMEYHTVRQDSNIFLGLHELHVYKLQGGCMRLVLKTRVVIKDDEIT
jgi:hypothetical protein